MGIRTVVSERVEREHPYVSTLPFYILLVDGLAEEYDLLEAQIRQALDKLGVAGSNLDTGERLRLFLDQRSDV